MVRQVVVMFEVEIYIQVIKESYKQDTDGNYNLAILLATWKFYKLQWKVFMNLK